MFKGNHIFKKSQRKPEIVVFIDGDYSDDPKEMKKIIDPIVNEGYDFVLGARTKRFRDKHSMTAHQIFGNWLACLLMKIFLILRSKILAHLGLLPGIN